MMFDKNHFEKNCNAYNCMLRGERGGRGGMREGREGGISYITYPAVVQSRPNVFHYHLSLLVIQVSPVSHQECPVTNGYHL